MKTKNKFLLNTLNILIFFILFNFINCSHKGSLHQFERIPKKDIIWIYGGNMQDDEVRILKVILKKLTREGFKYLDDQNFNERIQSRGLVIFGTPQNNLLIKKFASEQQICYSDTGLNFHNYFFKGPDHSIVMAYKDDQDRLIVLMISDRFENLLNLMWDDRYDFI
ncbi:MAG: hypothetical protein ABIL05_03000, partial [candidate division WOR-3 bacterium]